MIEVFHSADGGETYSPLFENLKAKLNKGSSARQKKKQTKADAKLTTAKAQVEAAKSLGKSSPAAKGPAAKSPAKKAPAKKGMSTGVIIGGGAALLLLIGVGFYLATRKKN
jgi:hypothetical protein